MNGGHVTSTRCRHEIGSVTAGLQPEDQKMSTHDDQAANQVIRSVLTKAMSDAAYRQTLLENPNEVVRSELSRSGAAVPDIQFDAVEETERRLVVRVPASEPERKFQAALEPLFAFVDSASAADLKQFVRAPRQKLQE